MADLVFRSTTRGGRDFFEVTDDGMTYGGKDRYNIKTDGSMNFADTVDEVLAELVFDGAWRINYDKIEVDELGIGKEFLEIVKLIRKKYNWLYNLPKGSKGRQFYYDIGRYFKQELKKGTDYGKIFNKIDEVIEKNNNFEESKEMNRKSIKEYRGTIDELIDNWASYKEKNDYYIHMYGVKTFDQVKGEGIPLYEAHFRYNSKGTSLVETEVKFGYADYVTNMTDSTCQKLLAEIIEKWERYKPTVNGETVDYPDIPKAWFYPFAQIVAEVLDVPNQKILKQYKEGKSMKKNRMTEKEESVIDKIQDLIDDTEWLSDVSFDMDEDEVTSADNVIEYLEDRVNEIEVIYYDRAMKLLSEHDASLQESLGYADEMGYSCGDLNSVTLATILSQEKAREELYDIRDNIEEVIDEWLEDLEDDE